MALNSVFRLAGGVVMALAVSACSTVVTALGKGPDPTTSPPPGMVAESYRNFAFAIPREWQPQPSGDSGGTLHWDDPAGQPMMSASFGTILRCPRGRPQEDGNARNGRLQAETVRPLEVPGAGGGWRYSVTGMPAGDSTEFRVWLPKCEKSLTLTVFASPAVADKIAATLVAAEEDK